MSLSFSAVLILAITFFAALLLATAAGFAIYAVSRRSPYAGSTPGRTTCPHCHAVVPASLERCSHCQTKLWATHR